MNQFLSLSSSSSSREQQCRVNTDAAAAAAAEDGPIPDLNIASVEEEEEEQHQRQYQEQQQQQQQQQQQTGTAAAAAAACGAAVSNGARLYMVKGDEQQHPDWLPQGWVAEVRSREGGHRDKVFYEPVTGKKFRSKSEVWRHIDNARLNETPKASASSSSSKEGTFCFLGASSNTATAISSCWPSGLDNLRNIIMNGVLAPSSSSLPSVESSVLDTAPSLKIPGVQDYWPSSVGGSSSWTEHFKISSSSSNGVGVAAAAAASSSLHASSSATASSTPHWLDRILNKGPSVPPPPPTTPPSGSLVHSPLHYLQNAGAFQNSWLHIKPPTQSNQLMDYSSNHHGGGGGSGEGGAQAPPPWKRWPWYSEQKPPRQADSSKRLDINLNQAFDPEDHDRPEDEAPESSRAEAWRPPPRPMENFWENVSSLEQQQQRIVASSNGLATKQQQQQQQQQPHYHHHHQHQHQHHQQQQHQQMQMQQLHKSKEFEVGVVRKSSNHKVDRQQEKKRMEVLGKRVCQTTLGGLLAELKDRERLPNPK